MAYTLLDAAYAMYYPEANFANNPFRRKKKGLLRRAGGFAKRNAGKLALGGLIGGAALRYGGAAVDKRNPFRQGNTQGARGLVAKDFGRAKEAVGNAGNWAKSKNPFGKKG